MEQEIRFDLNEILNVNEIIQDQVSEFQKFRELIKIYKFKILYIQKSFSFFPS